MSTSKFIMAQKLQVVQGNLMGKELDFGNFEGLLSTIFEVCSKEGLTFWFNFHEDYCVLNLRDTAHENYELNIRNAYVGVPLTDEAIIENKLHLLQNAFLLTEGPVAGFKPPVTGISSEGVNVENNVDELIFTSDKPIPPTVTRAIDTIKAKGIPVTRESLRNHIPWSEISTDQRIKCTKFIKEMGASK